jgi:hypothetical protein
MNPSSQITEQQRNRAGKSRDLLNIKKVPMWGNSGMSLYVDDDSKALVQPARKVALRAMVLWAVALRAEGLEWVKAQEIISKWELREELSPCERDYLDNPSPDPNESRALVWRLESLWVMLWALGRIPHLPWPSSMCDVPALAKAMNQAEADAEFIHDASLIPIGELLDAQDLTLKIHWAIRDAWLNEKGLPEELDWRCEDRIPVNLSSSAAVVQERHLSLNWILRFMEAENWDDVDTST